jgi:hypothetical protein
MGHPSYAGCRLCVPISFHRARTYAERMFRGEEIGPLKRPEAHEAFVRPLDGRGVTFDGPLVEHVVEEVPHSRGARSTDGHGQLPLSSSPHCQHPFAKRKSEGNIFRPGRARRSPLR